MKRLFLLMILSVTSVLCLNAQTKSLHQLQQEFVDLRCGMFIHFNMPTFFNEDWPDPDAAPELFNPVRMDCKQWAKAAKSANMTYGCLTTKHHSGFCIWDTKTTDYSVMSSPFKRDVVKEYADAFRAEGILTVGMPRGHVSLTMTYLLKIFIVWSNQSSLTVW